MNKLLLVFFCLGLFSMCKAASVYNYVIPELLKREEDCNISCDGIVDDCAQRCAKSHIHEIVGDLRVVCQEGYCYCGFQVHEDA
ncbi:hypothetical protein HPULCUR_009411 [Helicostylum pulchrum]|uniref:Uncharacterized protein n=1 Tax=Helicostylum pulchrum TaxID=562976 RepID=A0ABP9YAD9_9FUNG